MLLICILFETLGKQTFGMRKNEFKKMTNTGSTIYRAGQNYSLFVMHVHWEEALM